MKKILIFYAAYGGGHLSAAKSIKECIETNYKTCLVELIDCMKYVNKTIDLITTHAYEGMAKVAPWAWGKVYSKSEKGPIAHISNNSNKLLALKLNKLLIEKSPDLIICTHPFASQMCAYLKRKGKLDAKIATVITDYAPHNQYLVGHEFVNYYFVAHPRMKQEIAEQGVDENKIYATGIPLSNKFLKHYNKTQILDSLELSKDKRTILFFGGGEFGLGKNRTYDMFEAFLKIESDFQVIAIAGKNEKMKKVFDDLVEQYGKQDSVKVLAYTNRVPELMRVSDLVVTKPGGLTTTESLASGVPLILINPIPGQEEENAEFFVNNNVAIWIKKHDNIDEVLNYLLSHPQIIRKMKINAKLLAKKNSTKDICKIVLESED